MQKQQAAAARKKKKKNSETFIATLSCGPGYGGRIDHINIAACFVKSSGVKTELKLRNGKGNRTVLYKSYSLSDLGSIVIWASPVII